MRGVVLAPLVARQGGAGRERRSRCRPRALHELHVALELDLPLRVALKSAGRVVRSVSEPPSPWSGLQSGLRQSGLPRPGSRPRRAHRIVQQLVAPRPQARQEVARRLRQFKSPENGELIGVGQTHQYMASFGPAARRGPPRSRPRSCFSAARATAPAIRRRAGRPCSSRGALSSRRRHCAGSCWSRLGGSRSFIVRCACMNLHVA